MFCLNKTLSDTFLKKLQSGEINPEKLAEMSSKERRSFFSDFLGEQNAVKVNELFETKLLLKNQQRGMVTWAKTFAGLKPEVKRDIVDRVNKMEKVLEPETQQEFLEDLAAHKMGVTITMEEAGHISELAKIVSEQKTIMEKSPRRDILKDATITEMDYGRARVAFGNYINDLKIEAKKQTTSEYIKEVSKDPLKAVSDVAGVAKSSKAALDLSYIFRQGWKPLLTHPKIHLANTKKAMIVAIDTFKGKAVMDEINAEIVSRPTYEKMKKGKLPVGVIEEAYPSMLPERIPVLGKFFEASANAFTAQSYLDRADMFDAYLDIAEKSGVDIDSKVELIGIAELASSLSGRGKLGRLEPTADITNKVFFAPRLLKSHIDVLLVHPLKGTTFQKRQASINLLKIISGTATILALANAMDEDSVEEDPRSANFGKIKVGNTRFDVSGGMSSLATLAMRMWSSQSKSSTSGIITEIEPGFGAKTRLDYIMDFFKNKLSPAGAVLKDIAEGQDFHGDKLTIAGELENLLMPLPITNYKELVEDPNSAPILWAMIADGIGIGTNTYGLNVNWDTKDTEEMKQLKEQLSETKFKEANDKFNNDYNDWFNSLRDNKEYIALSNDDKKKILSSKREDIKDDVLREYGFRYRKPQIKRLPKF